jgi:hypothetical protein
MKPQPKGPCYKIQLWRSQRVKGYEEELIISPFYPAMVDGHQVNLNKTGWETFINSLSGLGGRLICQK